MSLRPTIKSKLALIIALLLMPICLQAVLSWRDVASKVDVWWKEADGVRYLDAVWPLQVSLATAAGDGTGARIDVASVEALASYDAAFGTERTRGAFEERLKAFASFSQRFGRDAARIAATSAGQELIAAVGDGSGLILDPDLDSFYVMDAVVARIPLALDEAQTLAAMLQPLKAAVPLSNEDKTALAGSSRTLAKAAAGIELALGRSFGADTDGKLKEALSAPLADAAAGARGLADLLARANGNARGDASGRGVEVDDLRKRNSALIETLDVLWRASAAQLDRLIRTRIDRYHTELAVALGATLLLSLFAMLAAFVLGRSIVGGVSGLVDVLHDLGRGAMDAPVPRVNLSDEIGDVSRALRDFRDSIVERNKAAAAENERAVRATQAETLRTVAAEIERSLLGVAGKLDSSAISLQSATRTVALNADETATRVVNAVEALGGSAGEVESVTTSVRELALSIDEIARRAGEAADETSTASTCAADAARRGIELKRCTDEIAAIATLISTITAQTNLLALNATIEAARAGEAGRGFAVVAQEVKALADQTTRATGEIDQRVQAIRTMTSDVTGMVDGIARSIDGLQDISRSIAVAVEEQGTVTAQISASLGKAADGTTTVIAAIAELPEAAGETGRIARELESVAASLARDSGDLRGAVDALLQRLAA